jgi:hypothetical protein
MALKLAMVEKGIAADYHKIIYQNTDYRKGTTQCVMGLYVNQAHRDDNVNNWLKLEPFELAGNDLTREQMYTLITKPRPEERPVPVEAVVDAPVIEEPVQEDPITEEPPPDVPAVEELPQDKEEPQEPPLDGKDAQEPLAEVNPGKDAPPVAPAALKPEDEPVHPPAPAKPSVEVIETNIWAAAEAL